MIISLTTHASERIQERFDGDIHFQTKFKWLLKQIKRGTVKEYSGKREGTIEARYDGVKFIYEKTGNIRRLITTYSLCTH